MASFNVASAPRQAGRVFVVTGANSGLGLETAKMLAALEATVVIACRSPERGEAARREVESARSGDGGEVAAMALDLASLRSVESFAAALGSRFDRIDGLINNAGVMAMPRANTEDGFELQLGTNHLGHFALTARLSSLLVKSDAPCVVTVSSTTHWGGRIDFDDLMGERRYSPWGAYAQSKLANLLFTHELDRRAKRAGSRLRANAAHPGYAATNLQRRGPEATGDKIGARLMAIGNALVAQSAASGALPTLYAATHPEAKGGAFYGPRVLELWGAPKLALRAAASRDDAAASRLWDASLALTNVSFSFT